MLKRYYTFKKNEIQGVLKLLVENKAENKVKLCEHNVSTNSERYENFYYNGCKCAKCGAEAEFAALEKDVCSKDKYHINLYAIVNGQERLLTKDHIYPRSMGGYDALVNYQVLCEKCNSRKGSKTELTPEVALERGYTSLERVAVVKRLEAAKGEVVRYEKVLAEKRRVYETLQNELNVLIPPRDKKEFI